MIDKLLLIISFVFIFILLILSLIIEPKLTQINQLNPIQLDSLVKIQGQLIKIQQKSQITILTIQDSSGIIEAVLFERTRLQENQTIEVIGKLSKYNNQLQINIDKIKKCFLNY
ncbi:hypothetical protein COV15_02810 [Candidatus Woesearchaeota archaeon CG10_big_fil_rev_8_21_14_0_10_34_12]|nr:MAG: hypothetical protein COV15_02810 [Candidatus Woesearchaeota archaeon CG10_big_fil_rev_8_21_14_0_10_34_12]